MPEQIKITCYGDTEIWTDREAAKDFYLEAMMNSDGSENERYSPIYEQLLAGFTECSDEEDFDWNQPLPFTP